MFNFESSTIDHEPRLFVKVLNKSEELEKNYRLRYEVFCEELRWVRSRNDKREIDFYDKHSKYLGVFWGKSNLVGSLRLTASDGPTMIENEFAHLVNPNHDIRKSPDTIEVSRLSIRRDLRSIKRSNIVLTLIKGLLIWCFSNQIRFVYAVVENKKIGIYNSLGLPLKRIGPVIDLDGLSTVAAIMDLKKVKQDKLFDFRYTPLQTDNIQLQRLGNRMAAC